MPDAPLTPSIDLSAPRIASLLAPAGVRGGFVLAAFRFALSRALATSPVAGDRAHAQAWATGLRDARLVAGELRRVAWTIVLAPRPDVDPITRAAALVAGAVRFRAELADPACPPRLRAHCDPVFGTTLLPGADRFQAFRGAGRHVLVGARGALFALDVIDEGGVPRSETALAADLRACLGGKPDEDPPVLALTKVSRSDAAAPWARIAAANPGSSALVRDALFSLFLDGEAPPDEGTCGRLAHAAGPTGRCFWHAFQLVVFQNAQATIVGSYVAGVEGEPALTLAAKLGAVRPGPRTTTKTKRPPPRLRWDVDAADRAVLATMARATAGKGATDVGGFVRVPGCGERAWREAGVSPEAAVVVALRLALHEAVPDLDELECMANLGHFATGLLTRVGTATPALARFLDAASADSGTRAPDLPVLLRDALDAHQARVRAAKRLTNPELALEYACVVLAAGAGFWRFLVTWLTGLLATALASRAPAADLPDLVRPLLALDSSVPHGPDVAAVGRFGIAAPDRSIWVHHALEPDAVSFVVQLGADLTRFHAPILEALPRAVERVLELARAPRPATAPARADDVALAPLRLAYRRTRGLESALRPVDPGAGK
jgi:hypothetical protein